MPLFDIGFSPCPNDTFIFDALVNHKIDTQGFEFKVHLEDVQTLNEWSLNGILSFSKISYGVWPLVKNNYSLFNTKVFPQMINATCFHSPYHVIKIIFILVFKLIF